jgi:hypothetical protein
MNIGFYHPILNPEGTSIDVAGNDFKDTTIEFNTLADCFNPSKVDLSSATNPSLSPRPDGAYFGQISNNLIHRKTVLSGDIQKISEDFAKGNLSDVLKSGYQKTNASNVSVSTDRIVGEGGLHELSYGNYSPNSYTLRPDDSGYLNLPEGFVASKVITQVGGQILSTPDYNISLTDDGKISTTLFDWVPKVIYDKNIFNPDGPNSWEFGVSCSMSSNGNVLVILDSVINSGAGLPKGRIYTYDWNGSSWNYRNTLENTFGLVGSGLPGGIGSVSLNSDGSVLLLSYTNYHPDGGVGYNSEAKIRRMVNSGGSWVQSGSELSFGPSTSDPLINDIALSANGLVMFIGISELPVSPRSYRVEKWDFNGSTWVYSQTINEPQANSRFGSGISLSDDSSLLVIGADGFDGGATDSGRVYIYENVGGQYSLNQIIDPSFLRTQGYFGSSVTISGDGTKLFIGQVWVQAGAVQEYCLVEVYAKYSENNTFYNTQQTIKSPSSEDTSTFGSSIAVNSTGSKIVIGDPSNDENHPYNRGAAFSFNVYDLATWSPATVFESLEQNPDNQTTTDFGRSISISGNGQVMAVGERGDNNGKVHIYDLRDGIDWEARDGNGNNIITTPAGYSGTAFGQSVSLSDDGNTIAIGDYTPNSNQGIVYIMTWNGASWVLDSVINGSAAGNSFGVSVSLSLNSNYISVGSTGASGNAGIVQVFEKSGASWVQRGPNINNPGSTYGSFLYFGISCSISADGNKLVVGGHNDPSVSGGVSRGRVYTYNFTGTSWSKYSVDASANDGANNDFFGRSVSMTPCGRYMVVGAPEQDSGSTNGGCVYFFGWNGSSWTKTDQIFAREPSANEFMGYGVSIDKFGRKMIVSAHNREIASGRLGAVYTYDVSNRTRMGVYTEEHRTSIALSGNGNRLAIGVGNFDLKYIDEGRVFLYDWNGSEWTYSGYFQSSVKQPYEHFGRSVSLSYDGNIIAIGAPGSYASGNIKTGAVDVFYWNGSDWALRYRSISPNSEFNSIYGGGVALSGDGNKLIVGAPGENSGRGRVYALDWNGSSYSQLSAFGLPGATVNAYFGKSTAISSDGSIIAVGHPSGSLVRIYSFDGTTATYITTISGFNNTTFFANHIAVSGDGRYIAVGTPGENHESASVFTYQQGAAYIFERTQAGNDWVPVSKFNELETFRQQYSNFGTGVAVDANFNKLFVAHNQVNVNSQPAVYEIGVSEVVSGTQLTASQEIQPLSNYTNAYFSYDLCITADDSTLFVSELGYNNWQGIIRIFNKVGGTWVYDSDITSPNPPQASESRFGTSIDVTAAGDRLVVGSYRRDNLKTADGIVHVYEKSGGTWTVIQEISSPGNKNFGYFGRDVSVSADGSILIVGAIEESTNGVVRVFQWNGSSYTHIQGIANPDTTISGTFGDSTEVSADGTKLFIGAENHINYGTVYYYQWNGSSFQRENNVHVPKVVTNMKFGCSVSVSPDNNTLYVGSWGTPNEGSTSGNHGAVYIYDYSAEYDTFIFRSLFREPTPTVESQFGISVCASKSGNTVMIGSTGGTSNYGNIYEFVSGEVSQITYQETNITFPYKPIGGESFKVYGTMSNNANIVSVNQTADSQIKEISKDVISNSLEFNQIITKEKDLTGSLSGVKIKKVKSIEN